MKLTNLDILEWYSQWYHDKNWPIIAMNQTQAPSRLYRIKMNVNEQLQPHVKFGLPSSPIQKRKKWESKQNFWFWNAFPRGIFSPFYRSRVCVSLQTYWKGNFSLFWHDNPQYSMTEKLLSYMQVKSSLQVRCLMKTGNIVSCIVKSSWVTMWVFLCVSVSVCSVW